MDIPTDIRISVCIEQGSVFNFKHEVSGEGRQSKNRYFVVLNRNPKTDTILLLVTSTSQVAKNKEFVKRTRIPAQTIVTVAPTEYATFNVESAFNCNDIHEVHMSDLIIKIENGGSMNYPKLPKGTLARLITGVTLSPQVSGAHKRML